jgi:hypothetical protein
MIPAACRTDLSSLLRVQRTHGLAVGDLYQRAAILAQHAGCEQEALSDASLGERLLVAVCRADDPTSRGERIWRITLNTSRRRREEDRIDGQEVGWCADWPMTARARRAKQEAVAYHLGLLRAALRSL